MWDWAYALSTIADWAKFAGRNFCIQIFVVGEQRKRKGNNETKDKETGRKGKGSTNNAI